MKNNDQNFPKNNIPYRDINKPFRFVSIVPGKGIRIEKDPNGVLFISSESGMDVTDLLPGDNIEFTYTDDGKIIVSAINTVSEISAGQNVTIDIDPQTGTAIINSVTDGVTNEHYQGVFDTPQDLIAFDSEPEEGDYGLIKKLYYSDGGSATWSGEYKYCFFIGGQWTVVDQMLTFTSDTDLLRQFYSVGGSSPAIYLHTVARTGDFNDLRNIPIVATPEVTVEGSTVTATCETEGAEIHYTTDGSMPHAGSTLYSGPISVLAATSFRFVAVKNGMINSVEAEASADYPMQEPVISLDSDTGLVSIENPNAGGTVYFTTNGSTPTDQSTEYTEPYAVPDVPSITIKAIVIDNGTESPVAVTTYKRIGAGYFGVSTNWIKNIVYLNLTAPANATIHYTTDGSTPTPESPGGGTAVASTAIYEQQSVKYRVFCEGFIPSSVMSKTIGYVRPSTPSITFDQQTGLVTILRTGETLNLNSMGAYAIYYTTDGSTPTSASTLYSAPFAITGTTTVKAILIAYGEYSSNVAEAAVTVLQPASASFDYKTGLVTMENPNQSGSIYYTTDGSAPTSESTLYTGPFALAETTTLKMAVIAAGAASAVNEQMFVAAHEPVITESEVNWSTGMYDLQITNPNNSGAIHYTTDGSNPTEDSPVFSESIKRNIFDGQITVKAIVLLQDYLPSAVASKTTGESAVSEPAVSVDETNKVIMSLAGNTVDIPLQTNNNVPTMGARIYYTTDGTTPTAASTLYTGGFVIPEDTVAIKAVTICYGEYSSFTFSVDTTTIYQTVNDSTMGYGKIDNEDIAYKKYWGDPSKVRTVNLKFYANDGYNIVGYRKKFQDHWGSVITIEPTVFWEITQNFQIQQSEVWIFECILEPIS